MPSEVPIIYSRQFGPRRLVWPWRVAALGVGIGAMAILLIAAALPPDPSGVGTHARLGLENCSLLERSGLPCPSCGMTTSFAYFARGNVPASLYVQPMGTVLALGTAMAFWVGLYIGATGRPILRLLRPIPASYYLLPFFFFALLAWGWKMHLQFRGIDGWGG
jgi:hypothetical protein